MPRVRIGCSYTGWCQSCNVPLIEKKCGSCGSMGERISITPPGDLRPGFEPDRERICRAADEQFGDGVGNTLLPPGRIFLLNRAPAEDRMDEIVSDGMVLGAMRYWPPGGWQLILRVPAAVRIAPVASRGVVVADIGAVEPVLEGKNLLAPGVISTQGDIFEGDEVIVVDHSGEVIGTGSARKSTPELVGGRGQGIKIRWKGRCSSAPLKASSWDDAVEANRAAIGRMEERAVAFVKKVSAEYPLPTAVSISGGKDSLVTLLVVLEAGIRPKLLFVDTGVEFSETVDNVRRTAETHGLDLLVEEALASFWTGLEVFGPPAKDFRWCCKTCKLGPATRLIERNFPHGVLSFIGQRSQESEQRAAKNMVWKNPWVPNQIGASPIQNWTGLQVWLYIFEKGADFNSLYKTGLHRVGCWLCPSTDMGDAEVVSGMHPDEERWSDYLNSYAVSRGLSEKWLEYALWRWKKKPSWAAEMFSSEAVKQEHKKCTPNLLTSDGYHSCKEGISLEGVISPAPDMDAFREMLCIMGKEIRGSEDYFSIEGIAWRMDVYRDGGVVIYADTEKVADRVTDRVRRVLARTSSCLGCGVCLGACKPGALSLSEGKIAIDVNLCNHCGQCLERCPLVDFSVSEEWNG